MCFLPCWCPWHLSVSLVRPGVVSWDFNSFQHIPSILRRVRMNSFWKVVPMFSYLFLVHLVTKFTKPFIEKNINSSFQKRKFACSKFSVLSKMKAWIYINFFFHLIYIVYDEVDSNLFLNLRTSDIDICHLRRFISFPLRVLNRNILKIGKGVGAVVLVV